MLSVVIFYFGLLSFIAFSKEKPIKCFISCGHIKGVKTTEPHSLGQSKRFNGGGRLFWVLITHFCQRPGENYLPREIYPSSLEVILSRVSFSPGEKVILRKLKKLKKVLFAVFYWQQLRLGNLALTRKKVDFPSTHTFPSFPSLPHTNASLLFEGWWEGRVTKIEPAFISSRYSLGQSLRFHYICRSLN